MRGIEVLAIGEGEEDAGVIESLDGGLGGEAGCGGWEGGAAGLEVGEWGEDFKEIEGEAASVVGVRE